MIACDLVRLATQQTTLESVPILVAVGDSYAAMRLHRYAIDAFQQALSRCDLNSRPLVTLRLADMYMKVNEPQSAFAILADSIATARQAGTQQPQYQQQQQDHRLSR